MQIFSMMVSSTPRPNGAAFMLPAACCLLPAACCLLRARRRHRDLSYQFYQERHKTTEAALLAAPLLPLAMICQLLMRDSA